MKLTFVILFSFCPVLNGIFCSNNGEVLRDAAISGLGIIILPDFIVSSAIASQELEIILPEYQAKDLTSVSEKSRAINLF